MTDARPRSRFRYEWILAPLLLMAAYMPAMQGEFLMSDLRVIVNNPRLTSLHGLLSIWALGSSPDYPVLDQYQPLTYTLWWIERHLWGLEPSFYQLVSVALHALNSFLVWRLFSRVGVRGAFVAAAVFALHPVHVESVAWIYEQKNPLSGVFFFTALHAYLNFDHGKRARWYAVALVLFALALLSKASTVVLPGVLLLYLWFRRAPRTWRALTPVAPFFALAALMAGVTIWHEASVTGASGELYTAGALERVARAGWVLGFHAGKLLVPIRLAFFYPSWAVDPSAWVSYLPDLLILIFLAVLWLRRGSWGRPALWGVGWYLVLFFPVAGFFDIYYHQFSLMADHFQYLPSVGLIALIVHAGATGLQRIGAAGAGVNSMRHRSVARIAAVLVVASLGLLTWQRSHVFVNNGVLSRDAAEKYPASWLAFEKSAAYILRRARPDFEIAAPLLQQALDDLEHAAKIRPNHPQIQDSLGVAYSLSGRLQDARRHMRAAVELDSDNPNFHWNLATLYEQLNETQLALAEYQATVAAAPESPMLRLRLARALVEARRFHEGVSELDTLIEQTTGRAAADPRMAEVLRRAHQLRVQTRARVAFESDPPPAPSEDRLTWNVLLLTVDTLRPDYLSLNGHDLPTTPFLDEMIGAGVYFEQALTPVPRTTPALASLFTGAYPHATGVRALASQLPEEMVTLAEAFRDGGYQTLAVVTNLLLAPVRGLDAGFDLYDAAPDSRGARNMTDAALRYLEALDPEKPLFAWVHYIDPHVPYHPKPVVAESFDPGYDGRFRLSFGRQPKTGEPPDLFQHFPAGLTKSQVTHRNPLTDAENAHIRRLYAGDVKLTDEQIERLVRAVRERFPRTVIVFSADHGESLGEHSFYFDHGDYVYNASSRVPLAFVLPPEHPWHGSGRRAGWVSLVDVAPTLFDVVGREPPPEMAVLFEGRSLAPQLRGEPMPAAPVFIESGTSFFPELVARRQRNDVAGRFRAVVFGGWKLIWTPFLPEPDAWELYDLRADPDETENLYRPGHPQVAALKHHLERWLAAESPLATAVPLISEDDRKALRMLGYTE